MTNELETEAETELDALRAQYKALSELASSDGWKIFSAYLSARETADLRSLLARDARSRREFLAGSVSAAKEIATWLSESLRITEEQISLRVEQKQENEPEDMNDG
ncbi:MAG: hypothetical protein OXL41_03975 [Nitrospinae bacterium]|nr:hypothetical protein [Nitrospinota bacterium]